MRYLWRFPEDVCGNSGEGMWLHAAVVCFTLFYAAHFPRKRRTLLLFAVLEFAHGHAHYVGRGTYVWVHYATIACAYSIKPAPLRVFVPFLCVDTLGHLVGNDMISIGTTLAFAATRFDSTCMKQALAITFILFAFMELVACDWFGGHLHEVFDIGLGLAMMVGVRWYALTD